MPSAYDKVLESRKELVEQVIVMMQERYNNKEAWNRGFFTPHNPLSGATYKGGNKLRLMIEGARYSDPRWMTFKQIKEAGYKLETGAKGVLCEKWIFPEQDKKETETSPVQTDKAGAEKATQSRVMVSYFYVFNASKVKDFPAHEMPEPLPQDKMLQLADDLIESSECEVLEEEQGQGRAYYSRSEDYIVLPPRPLFKSTEAFTGTLLHEMAHSTGHEERLNRIHGASFGDENYAREELVAELSTIFSAADMKMAISEEGLQDNSDYLKSWVKVLSDNPNELFRACVDADKASGRIVENYRQIQEIREQEEVKDEQRQVSVERGQKVVRAMAI